MICDTCKKPIEGSSLSALGKNYHPEHFVCGVCNKPITDKSFHQRDGKPICQKDYEASSPLCATCGKPILSEKVTALGQYFHPDHFACKLCKHPITGRQFHEREGKPVCNSCFVDKVADKCKGCGVPITTTATIALAAKWHPECFKCAKCQKVIESETFKVDNNGYPLCVKC